MDAKRVPAANTCGRDIRSSSMYLLACSLSLLQFRKRVATMSARNAYIAGQLNPQEHVLLQELLRNVLEVVAEREDQARVAKDGRPNRAVVTVDLFRLHAELEPVRSGEVDCFVAVELQQIRTAQQKKSESISRLSSRNK